MAPKEYDWSMIAQHPKYLALKKSKGSTQPVLSPPFWSAPSPPLAWYWSPRS